MSLDDALFHNQYPPLIEQYEEEKIWTYKPIFDPVQVIFGDDDDTGDPPYRHKTAHPNVEHAQRDACRQTTLRDSDRGRWPVAPRALTGRIASRPCAGVSQCSVEIIENVEVSWCGIPAQCPCVTALTRKTENSRQAEKSHGRVRHTETAGGIAGCVLYACHA